MNEKLKHFLLAALIRVASMLILQWSMNFWLKNFILGTASLLLIFATLFIPMPAQNSEQMKHVRFGYPFNFISQDFSGYDRSFHFFPRYQRFESNSPINDFSWIRFLFSFLIVFLFLSALIYILEIISFKIHRVIYKK